MPPISEADLKDIQGVSVGRFRKDHQDLLFIQFETQQAGRELIGRLVPRIANAWEVQHFNELYSEIQHRGAPDSVEATWVALGISAHGYGVLGVNLSELGTSVGATAFCEGMAARSSGLIGDLPQDQPSNWLEPFQPPNAVDAVIVVAADTTGSLDATTDQICADVEDCGSMVTFRERGGTLPPPLKGHEHFGFKDGVSQPRIEGFDPPPAPAEPAAQPPGAFVLGQPTSTGTPVSFGSLWHNGSYGIFRRLTQDVAGFRAQAASMAAQVAGISNDQLAADLVGRWPSGTPLANDPTSDPGPSGVSNAFDYSTDPGGANTQLFAHIRKVYPRNEQRPDQTPDPSDNHRMIRAGIPFGEPLPPGAQNDGAERGLHFLSFVADPDQQFEFVQRQWANDPNFPGGTPNGPNNPYSPAPTPPGCDPVIGAHNPGASVSLDQGGTIHQLPLMAETVRVTAGEYFYYPAISAASELAAGATSSTPPSPAPSPTTGS